MLDGYLSRGWIDSSIGTHGCLETFEVSVGFGLLLAIIQWFRFEAMRVDLIVSLLMGLELNMAMGYDWLVPPYGLTKGPVPLIWDRVMLTEWESKA